MNTPTWRKSSHSGSGAGGGEDCIEVAALGDSIGVRDSKAPSGPHLSLARRDFSVLVGRIKQGDV
ncbi:DUF397 domain-containing protein [Spirillospora sp. NPDC047279]|uniref:DUF397 domain-containing protein n=1 Tax=Spirillospora sp. NPDC047279 TaxID=3155478 RepID=UPI00340AC589